MKILIVDDHPLIRDGLAVVINGEPDLEVCGEAGSAEEALPLVIQLMPELVIVDLALPGVNGLELVKNIRAAEPKTRILVFSAYEEETYAERTLRAGAHGYLRKREAKGSLLEAIRTVISGESYVSEKLRGSILHRYLHGAPVAGNATPIETLTDRELEILELIGQGLSSKEISTRLHLSHKTVDAHRTHIKEKLRLRDAAELTRFATSWRAARLP